MPDKRLNGRLPGQVHGECGSKVTAGSEQCSWEEARGCSGKQAKSVLSHKEYNFGGQLWEKWDGHVPAGMRGEVSRRDHAGRILGADRGVRQ